MTTPDKIPLSIDDAEIKLLQQMVLRDLIQLLSDKDRDTILLWSNGYSLSEIATYINHTYERRPPQMPLSANGVGPRIRKILKKLRKYAKEG